MTGYSIIKTMVSCSPKRVSDVMPYSRVHCIESQIDYAYMCHFMLCTDIGKTLLIS